MSMAAFLPTIISLAAGSMSSAAAGGQEKPSQNQQMQTDMTKMLYQSLMGNGPHSDLFNADDATFQKSFVDPAKSMFSNQIAPQIQQSYINSGQQRGTGLDDTLTRAGVDMDQILNQHFAQFQQQANQRKLTGMGMVMNSQGGVPAEGPSFGNRLLQGAAGQFASKGFQKTMRKGFDSYNASQTEGTA